MPNARFGRKGAVVTAVLSDVMRKIKPDPTPKQRAAEELVRRAREQGLSLIAANFLDAIVVMIRDGQVATGPSTGLSRQRCSRTEFAWRRLCGSVAALTV